LMSVADIGRLMSATAIACVLGSTEGRAWRPIREVY
jgi:hypothetical protein